MSTPRTVRFRRRLVLAMPALVAAATSIFLRPTPAAAKTQEPECLADVMGAS